MAIMPDRVDRSEWTNDEWIRVLKEFLPGVHVKEAEEAVARWRKEDGDAVSKEV
jgi:hypothetical protein